MRGPGHIYWPSVHAALYRQPHALQQTSTSTWCVVAFLFTHAQTHHYHS